jgi:hypothetical protein
VNGPECAPSRRSRAPVVAERVLLIALALAAVSARRKACLGACDQLRPHRPQDVAGVTRRNRPKADPNRQHTYNWSCPRAAEQGEAPTPLHLQIVELL